MGPAGGLNAGTGYGPELKREELAAFQNSGLSRDGLSRLLNDRLLLGLKGTMSAMQVLPTSVGPYCRSFTCSPGPARRRGPRPPRVNRRRR